jgi:hypothetical protein
LLGELSREVENHTQVAVIPMQMGIHFEFKGLIWIPAFAGMTASVENQGVSQLNFSAPKS